MRLVIDLQGAQTPGSRHRGIGRYSASLTKAIAGQIQDDELFVVVNGHFVDSVCQIREELKGLVRQDQIKVWYPVGNPSFVEANNSWEHRASRLIRKNLIKSLKPDAVLLTSIFEGFDDESITCIKDIVSPNTITASIAYDLIPLIYQDKYLVNAKLREWYMEKVSDLLNSDLLLAISESTRKECIEFLGISVNSITNISSAVDKYFKPQEVSSQEERDLRAKYGFTKSIVMYTGGIDIRKNIEGLIQSFVQLPDAIRNSHQLAIVCSTSLHDRKRLEAYTIDQGLIPDEDVVFTGYVPKSDLRLLYCLCKIFIFPSWHEGFGLPILEAMACGSAIICSNVSSIPEIINYKEALFDPHDTHSITAKLEQVLVDSEFRHSLRGHCLARSKDFSWTNSAMIAIKALKESIASHRKEIITISPKVARSYRAKLAYISPLPPKRSGIADYSLELLPYLSEFYDIEVVEERVDDEDSGYFLEFPRRSAKWLYKNKDRYDRIVYQFGNSAYHAWMIDLLYRLPGVVVLHDFFLSGLIYWLDSRHPSKGYFHKALYQSHGYPALEHLRSSKDELSAVNRYPCNIDILNNSMGVVVHSEYAKGLAREWYGSNPNDFWHVIPHMRETHKANTLSKSESRMVLGLHEDAFIIGSFGILAPTKLNKQLIEAWINTPMAQAANSILVLVGEGVHTEYGRQLLKEIEESGKSNQVFLTDRVDPSQYRHYLNAVDLAVQLRTTSRGETSGAALDCMNFGIPTIVNRNGSMNEIPTSAVFHISEDFTTAELANAMTLLYQNRGQRNEIGLTAKKHLDIHHSPKKCASLYEQAIEACYSQERYSAESLAKQMAAIGTHNVSKEKLVQAAVAIERSVLPAIRQSRLFIDITQIMQRENKSRYMRAIALAVSDLVTKDMLAYRIELVYFDPARSCYLHASRFCLKHLKLPKRLLGESVADFRSNDALVCLSNQSYGDILNAVNENRWLDSIGVQRYTLDFERLIPTTPGLITSHKELVNILTGHIQHLLP